MIWEIWFQPGWTHFLFAAGLVRAFTMKVGIVIVQEEAVSPNFFFLWAHFSVTSKVVNLGIANIDDRDPWRGFKAGGDMVRLKGASLGLQGG